MLHDQGVILATVLGSAMVLAGVAALPLAGAFLLGVELVATGSVLFAATLESAG
jgi:NhaP-type Na+/H+ or K+/H+ antiporter